MYFILRTPTLIKSKITLSRSKINFFTNFLLAKNMHDVSVCWWIWVKRVLNLPRFSKMQIQRLNKKFELELIIITNSKTIDTQPHQHWQYKIIINTEKQNNYAAAEIKKGGKKKGSTQSRFLTIVQLLVTITKNYKHHKKWPAKCSMRSLSTASVCPPWL